MAHEILKTFIKHQKEAGRPSISIDELETMLASYASPALLLIWGLLLLA